MMIVVYTIVGAAALYVFVVGCLLVLMFMRLRKFDPYDRWRHGD